MIAAQAFLGALASDPSLRGIMDSLSTALLGVQHGQAKLEMLSAPLSAFGDHAGSRWSAGKPAYLSWRQLVGRRTSVFARNATLHHSCSPGSNYAALMPGKEATDAIRADGAEVFS
jgi:hypothetical protein